MTLNVGLRFDYMNNYVPAQHNGPGPWVPTRDVDFAEVDNVPNWKNVSPRIGMAYDLFGDGKTAVKVNLGRYLEGPNLTSFTRAGESRCRHRRQRDPDLDRYQHDFIPQPSELGALNQATFGNSTIVTTLRADTLTTRGYNWEFSAACSTR